ncbi:hypothetical protein DPM19_33270 [Actinomadura craniellae]|uniref:Uncharacterized protein n=2 Tax=Actinomadura craniellae TaxID=2231787 RepID=A0A365GY89_9ACTN|nr:hypothetical protein [Actinomadura craniellae]RAY10893.1 hypothetical protein DPM19_33270 [Actinomadura craniellae]
MLRHARELLAVRSPLDAELMVSEIFGSWWGQRLDNGDVDELIGEPLAGHAAKAGTPAALALLTGMAYLGTARQATLAEQAALELMDRGVARPGWADRIGMAALSGCYLSRDVYGDQDTIICTYTYGDTDLHALVVTVDHNRGGAPRPMGRPPTSGMVRDAWVSSKVDKLLAHCRRENTENPLATFGPLDPRTARAILEAALAITAQMHDPPVDKSFGSYHAFLRARVRTLPPGGRRPQPPMYSSDQRATMAAQFLASAEAEELSDLTSAGRCVDRIIDYGCTYDFGRPLRVSPTKCELFMLDWLPRKVLLSPAEQEAMPHVLAAWVRWAGRRIGLPERAIRATLDALWDATGKFAEAYRHPTTFGLERELVDRLLPDGELEALPRRAFALPFLSGRHGSVDLSTLDPADPADRRIMLEFEHPGASEAHLAAHERLAARLWAGDPPQLWDTAQALLDVGYERHEILHRLIEAVDQYGKDPVALRAALRALRHGPPPE